MKSILTAEEVAKELQVSVTTIYSLIKEGEIKHFKVGGQYRIQYNALQEYINRQGDQEQTSETVLVTQHDGAYEWMIRQGVKGPRFKRARRMDVVGRIVYGILPVPLAWFAKEYFGIEIPGGAPRPFEELTADEMEEAGARFQPWVVLKGTHDDYRSCLPEVSRS